MKKWFIIALAAFFGFLLSLGVAQAAEFRPETKPIVAKNEVIDDDLYIAGGNVSILGTVNGDLFVAGGTVDVAGTIGGDVMGAGGWINIQGKVADDVRMAGGGASISGEVNGDVFMAGGTVQLAESARVGGDLVVGGSEATIAGEVGGRLFGGATQMTISGQINKDATIGTGWLTLEPSAKIKGNLIYESTQEADIKPGAEIAGTVTRQEPEVEAGEATGWSLFEVLRDRFRWLLTPPILGLILVFVFPQTSLSIADTLTGSPWKSLGMGLLALLVVPLIIVAGGIAGIVVGGFPIALALAALFLMVLLLSHVFVAIVLGDLVLRLFGAGAGMTVWSLLVGLVILAILGLIPYISAITLLLALIFGSGALVLFEWRALSRARSEGKA